MYLEPNRMIVDWLTDPTDGVNALLPSTPRDSGDDQPAALATITDETSNGDVARGELPATLPGIAVSLDVLSGLDGQVQTVTADGRVKLRIRIGVKNPDSARAKQDLSYYTRTTIRSLRRFFQLDANDARRFRNDLYLETCLEITSATDDLKDAAGSITPVAYVFPVIQIRDLLPLT